MIHSIIRKNDELSELRKRFIIEKEAKNRAYLFILSSGLLDEFASFRVNVQDTHSECVKCLIR